MIIADSFRRLVVISWASLLWLSQAATGQPEQLLDDPEFNARLANEQNDQFELGELLPRVALDCRFHENAIIDNMLRDHDGAPVILFTSVPTNWASYKFFPNIVLRIDENWTRFPIPYTRDGWTYIHSSSDSKNLLIAMDNVPEGPDQHLRILISDDGGRNWRYAQTIEKYAYADSIRFFKMDEYGTGTAVEFNDGGTFDDIPVGYFVHETLDWGFSWSPSTFQKSFDTTGFDNVIEKYHEMRSSRAALRDLSLPGFTACPIR